jgi:hypothetical protein
LKGGQKFEELIRQPIGSLFSIFILVEANPCLEIAIIVASLITLGLANPPFLFENNIRRLLGHACGDALPGLDPMVCDDAPGHECSPRLMIDESPLLAGMSFQHTEYDAIKWPEGVSVQVE